MNDKIKVAVLMGGKTPEHEISLISGREVTRNLPKKYDVFPIIISRDGNRWSLVDKKTVLTMGEPLKLLGTNIEILDNKVSKNIVSPQQINGKVDICFIAMHGPFGEDGTIQGMLELVRVPYTGSGVLASAIGMDKIMFRKIMKAEGIPIPRFISLKRGEKENSVFKTLGSPPYFVKPHNQGSSVGASIVKSGKDLKKALKRAYQYSGLAIVEEYIKGKEVTGGVLGNDKPIALPLVEIIPKNEFFDYESKYTESGTQEITPARISKELTKKIQKLAVKVYKAIGARGFSRVDFLLEDNRNPVVLEINTIPGLTPMSLLPKAAKTAGIEYPELLDKIVTYALQKLD